ncbi:hypothetical protein NDU88_007790 [Pleurodeles waltl]|uniref:Uncharacterized protein n=1 Tax=Pleurodeles waltl TaxID=8319 RepID=A0AAV7NXB6_PLEWA|nr:hypothetical protein NDU88_007790 [Pleurodeles waltl]
MGVTGRAKTTAVSTDPQGKQAAVIGSKEPYSPKPHCFDQISYWRSAPLKWSQSSKSKGLRSQGASVLSVAESQERQLARRLGEEGYRAEGRELHRPSAAAHVHDVGTYPT